MQPFHILALTFLISFVGFCKFDANAEAVKIDGKCLNASIAQEIKGLLEKKKFYIDFCSTCNSQKASIRRIDIAEINLSETDCGQEIKIKGKIVRGVKPPVFDGTCINLLEVYSPSISLDLPFETTLNPVNAYVWDDETKNFTSIVGQLGGTKACIEGLVLKK